MTLVCVKLLYRLYPSTISIQMFSQMHWAEDRDHWSTWAVYFIFTNLTNAHIFSLMRVGRSQCPVCCTGVFPEYVYHTVRRWRKPELTETFTLYSERKRLNLGSVAAKYNSTIYWATMSFYNYTLFHLISFHFKFLLYSYLILQTFFSLSSILVDPGALPFFPF